MCNNHTDKENFYFEGKKTALFGRFFRLLILSDAILLSLKGGLCQFAGFFRAGFHRFDNRAAESFFFQDANRLDGCACRGANCVL